MASAEQPPQRPEQIKNRSRLPWIIGGCAVLLIAVVILAALVFGVWRLRAARPSNANAPEAPPTGIAPGSGQPSSGRGGPQQTENPVGSPGQNQAATAPSTMWDTTVTALNGKVGQTLILSCPPGGQAHSVWGSDIYTADSSICTAAVHAGLITFEQGGTVTLEVRPGRPVYGSTNRNGVNTSNYGSYSLSFVFRSGTDQGEKKEADDVTPIAWSTPATIVNGEAGKTFKFECPAGGNEHAIWGTDVYTADSSVCTAAVHAGRITFEQGGTVTIESRPGQSSYQGTSRNGVKSSEYGSYPRSFAIK